MTRNLRWTLPFLGFLGLAGLGLPSSVQAEPWVQGPEVCSDCHTAEFEVWEGTAHHKSFDDIFDSDKLDAILEAAGEDDLETSPVCTTCHITLAKEDADAEAEAVAGPSCESCHGASSDWFKIHNDFGGKGVKAEDETPEHKAERIAAAKAAGMVRPEDTYGVAANCMSCHGLSNEKAGGDVLSAMLAAGHPLNLDYELVQYSQGSVRHRFYPPDMTVNQELDAAGLAETWIMGQAAKLVSAADALQKSGISDDYKSKQQTRLDAAAAELQALGLPEADALVAAPGDAAAQKLEAAIEGKDMSAKVAGKLPDPKTYK